MNVRYGLPFVEAIICYRGEELHLKNVLLDTEIGEMNYGMDIDGILGFDFIQTARLVIDSMALTVTTCNK